MANVDATAKRYYPAILCGLLGSIAYLQGGGISSLVAEQLPGASQAPAAPPKPLGTAKTSDKSAQPILARNAFDSETGPLTGKPPPPPKPTAVAVAHDAELPRCTAATVVAITDSDDPAFSFALIKTSGPAKMRRIGDDIDGKKLEEIGWDRIVLSSSGSKCQLRMMDDTGGKPAGLTGGAEAPPKSATGAPTSKPIAGASGVDIRKVSDNEFVIERGGAEKMTQMQQAFMKSARVVEGQGIRLQRSASTTILNDLGMQKGDLVKTINGFDMTNPDKAMEAYGTIKTAKKVQVVLERDGKPVTLDYSLQ